MNPNIEKQEIRSYLLGDLEADRRAALEESIWSDPAVYEEVLAAEQELIDQYITNNLSPSERQQFETNFLITEARQDNLRFGRLLKRYLDSQTETPAPAKKFLPFSVSAAVVASIAIIVLVCWISFRKPLQQRAVAEDASHLVKVQLSPGSQQSEGLAAQRVEIPPQGFDVRLELQVSNTTFRNYKSELIRENNSLKTSDELKAEPNGAQHVVPWTITGDVLSPGDYQIRLSGVVDSGQDEFIDNYSFRVTK